MLALVLYLLVGGEVSCEFESNHSGEVTLVTAFFDIGRREFQQWSRSNEQYLKYFKRWARIKNFLFVYCQDEIIKGKVLNIRRFFGLENKTVVVVLGDLFSFERDIYRQMVKISSNSDFFSFRNGGYVPENIPAYNYVNFMKTYFLNQVIINFDIKTDSIAWIDFGFDHGGVMYAFEKDWSFTLKCEKLNKISLFYLPPQLDDRPLFEIVRTVQPASVEGCFFVCPKRLVNVFKSLFEESVYNLLELGLMDDDQPILLLCFRKRFDLFEIKPCYWFLAVKEYCSGPMRVKKERKIKRQKKHKITKKTLF